MYNLLLVDDEPYILEGLRYNINWENLDIQEVYQAENGEDALKILSAHKIDLVITDIRMLGMDGLSMSEQITQQWPYTKIIILSGYRTFEYAQRAISTHIFRYLVKPVRYEELEQAAGEALAELQADLQKKSVLENTQKKLEMLRPFLQQRYLTRWLENGALDPLENWEDAESCGIQLKQGDFGFFVIVSIDQSKIGIQKMEALQVAAADLCHDILGQNTRILDYFSLKEKIAFLFLEDDAERMQRMFNLTVERLEPFLYSLQNTLNCQASIFWDFPVKLEELGDSYRGLSRRVQRYLSNRDGVISGPDILNNSQHPFDLRSLHLHPSFQSLVAAGKKADVLERLATILQEVLEQNCTHEQVLQVYHTVIGSLIADSLQRQITIQSWGEAYMDFLGSANATHSFQDFALKCRGAAASYLDFLEQNQQLQENKLISRIRAMVSQSLGEDLSVSRIASACHYNAVYLSRLFKEETGYSLQDYIIQKRMEKAQQLLRGGEKIGDVAVAVGYENSPHFSRAFKKFYGVSPKQYQSSGQDST